MLAARFRPALVETLAPIGVVALAMVDFALLVPQSYLSNVLRWNMRIVDYVVVSVARALLIPMLSILLVVVLRKGISGYFLAALLGDLLVTSLCFWVTRDWLRVELQPRLLRGMLRYALPLVPSSVSLSALELADRYFINTLGSRSDLGLFAVASKLGQVVVFLTDAYRRAWMPWAMSMWREETAPQTYAKAMYYTTLLLSALACATALFAREVIRLFTGPQFRSAYRAVLPLMLGALVFELYQFLSLGSQIAKKTSHLMWTAILAAACNVPLAWFLTKSHGFLGAAWALPLGYLPSVGLICALSQRVYPIPFPARKLLSASALPAVAGFLGLVLEDRLPLWWSILGKGFVGAVCAMVLFRLGLDVIVAQGVVQLRTRWHGLLSGATRH
jgi:O-antigen/teichoic acid export membrane protein